MTMSVPMHPSVSTALEIIGHSVRIALNIYSRKRSVIKPISKRPVLGKLRSYLTDQTLQTHMLVLLKEQKLVKIKELETTPVFGMCLLVVMLVQLLKPLAPQLLLLLHQELVLQIPNLILQL